jgi:hypothetical protein
MALHSLMALPSGVGEPAEDQRTTRYPIRAVDAGAASASACVSAAVTSGRAT